MSNLEDKVAVPMHHIGTQLEVDDNVGVLAACHFTKIGNNLQIAITTPSPNTPAVVNLTPEAVAGLINDLARWFLMPAVVDTAPRAEYDSAAAMPTPVLGL